MLKIKSDYVGLCTITYKWVVPFTSEVGAGYDVTSELNAFSFTSRMDKMDASKQTFVVLAVQEYTQLKNKYDVHLKNIMEEERRRRRY